MPPKQINLISSSFAKIYFTRDQSAKLFYDRLFAIDPEVRPLFTSDLEAQGRKLMDTLALVVATLNHPGTLDQLLQETARRHVSYGATAVHYQRVGEALLWMLEQQLGKDFTPEVKLAWTDVYDVIAQAMLRLGRESGQQ
jgi:nitric oxide dioxygenase